MVLSSRRVNDLEIMIAAGEAIKKFNSRWLLENFRH
jgi:hypothetical protein